MQKQKYLPASLFAALSLALSLLASPATASRSQAANEAKIVKELQPTVKILRQAKCPVYLPSWMPERNKAKFSQALLENSSDFPNGYEVSLGVNAQEGSIASCDTFFYMHGGNGHASGKHPVQLSGGRTGFLKNALIEWNQGKCKYGIGFIGPTSRAEMIKCANSVVLLAKK